MKILGVDTAEIGLLSALQLTTLLKQLLKQEARSAGIAARAIDVALNITVSDGGEDGRIEWNGEPKHTAYLPTRLVQFQCKAVKEMGKSEYAKEILTKEGRVKPRIDEALRRGGAYIVFASHELNRDQKDSRIKAIRDELDKQKKPYAQSAIVEIYDAGTIQSWCDEYIAAVTAVCLAIGRPMPVGMRTWHSWSQFDEYQLFDYVADEQRADVIRCLRELLTTRRAVARVIGLSGLGKTRLALEACGGGNEFATLKDVTVYIDATSEPVGLPGIVTSWVQRGLEGVMVVDNCTLSMHEKLAREIRHPESQLSLLTIHFGPDVSSDNNQFRITQLDDSALAELLKPAFADKIPDLDRIVRFAQGFPQMAYLLARARLRGDEDMGSLTDDGLVSKLLWGDRPRKEKVEAILRGCAVFDKFGIEDEAEVEAKFIAKHVLDLGIDDVHGCIKDYERWGIVNRAGRYARIVPKPLAIRLAADWWRRSRKEKQIDLITQPMPGQLEDSFCEQISMLDFLPEVKELTESLCGSSGPFGQAEVTLSDRGSRLFRALVEVNPRATAAAIYSILTSIPISDIRSIEGDVRRNLVIALEKLAFRQEQFTQAAWSLLLLAANENESWSNNATGQFTQLFDVFLSGTEAEPSKRFELIDRALASENIDIRKLCVDALDQALDRHGGTRTVGAEYQGSGRPLSEWRPTIWKNVFDYYIEALRRLLAIALEGSEISPVARQVIGRRIRGLMRVGNTVAEMLDTVVKAVVSQHGPLWPEAISSIQDSLEYDSTEMPPEGIALLRSWQSLLTPVDLEDRLELLVSIPPYNIEKDSEELVDVAERNATDLAREISAAPNQLFPYINKLLMGEQRQAACFGSTLAKMTDVDELLARCLEELTQIENANPSFVFGLLGGIYGKSPEAWGSHVSQFLHKTSLLNFYVAAITTGKLDAGHLDTVLELVRRGDIDARQTWVLTMGKALDHLSPNVVGRFVDELSQTSDDGVWPALDILAMYCHGNSQRWSQVHGVTERLLISARLDRKERRRPLEMHHWREAAIRALESGSENFAVQFTQTILTYGKEGVEYGDMYHYVKPVLRKILGLFPEAAWDVIGAELLSADGLQSYLLSVMLEPEDKFRRTDASVIESMPLAKLEAWCSSNPDKAPPILAGIGRVLDNDGDTYKLTDLGLYLLDNFGDSEEVLGELSRNLSSFGWTGSVIPHFEKEIDALSVLKSHRAETVRKWAEARIARLEAGIDVEGQRDAESEWGVR